MDLMNNTNTKRTSRLKIQNHRHHLISYIFVLRLTPVFPGWFLNLSAAHVGIPLRTFAAGTVMGTSVNRPGDLICF